MGITEHIGLLKIDTKGFNLAVLRCATKAAAEQRIDLIAFEFNRHLRNRWKA